MYRPYTLKQMIWVAADRRNIMKKEALYTYHNALFERQLADLYAGKRTFMCDFGEQISEVSFNLCVR